MYELKLFSRLLSLIKLYKDISHNYAESE